jgi:hypothetical protein
MKYVVVCYSIHNKNIASYDPFDSEEDAQKFLEEDAESTYNEEVENASKEDVDNIEMEVNDGYALVSSCNGEYQWSWEIIQV